ncbi:MAG: type II toxin-antitoxin system RelE/ParE family toxin [Chloroflexota bacterium]
MIASFADNATRDIYNGIDSRDARRLPRQLWLTIRRKLDYIDVARRVDALRVPPGNRPEALRGDQAGRWSIRVNDQYRITFRFDDGEAHDIRCEDYH